MGLSRLAIKNMALSEVPAQRLDSEDERSVEAEACENSYKPALELLIDAVKPDFATRRAILAPITNDRAHEWAFAYRLPTDCIEPTLILPFLASDPTSSSPDYSVVGKLRGFEGGIPFRVSDGVIYTNQEQVVLEYVSSDVSEAMFSPLFARALAFELASRIVMPIKKDRTRQGDLIKAAEAWRERAKAADMNRDRESTRDFVPDSQLVRSGVLPWQYS
jgi:hypothetical protein